MKSLMNLLILGCFIGLTACGSDGNNDGAKQGPTEGDLFGITPSSNIEEPNSVFGLWESEESDEGDATLIIRFRITETTTTNAARCSFNDGTNITAQVTVASRVEGDRLIIETGGEKRAEIEKNGNRYTCIAILEAGSAQLDPQNGFMRDPSTGALIQKIGN